MDNIMLDKKKYQHVFLYMLNSLGSIEGKKKVYKLLYFLDFDYFEAYDKPLIGETYTALKMGPAPKYFDALAKEMEENGEISISHVRKSPSHENDTVVYKPRKEIRYELTANEKKMLNRVLKLYGGWSGKKLEELSHCQAPYVAVGLGSTMPYELSYYRDTPDLTE